MENPVSPPAELGIPIINLDRFTTHLQALVHDPSLPFNERLFDDITYQINSSNATSLAPTYLPPLITLIRTTPHDPVLPATIAHKLLSTISYSAALAFAPPSSLRDALASPNPATIVLALTVVAQAAHSLRDIALIAADTPLIRDLLRSWLLSPHIEVGVRGARILADLLSADAPGPGGPANHVPMPAALEEEGAPAGRLWDVMFKDPQTYSIMIEIGQGTFPGMAMRGGGKNQVSLAQLRLLDLVPRIARHDFITTSTGLAGLGHPSLLHFVALEVGDVEDPGMVAGLGHFCRALLEEMWEAPTVRQPSVQLVLRNVIRDTARRSEDVQCAVAQELSMLKRMPGLEDWKVAMVDSILGLIVGEDSAGAASDWTQSNLAIRGFSGNTNS